MVSRRLIDLYKKRGLCHALQSQSPHYFDDILLVDSHL